MYLIVYVCYTSAIGTWWRTQPPGSYCRNVNHIKVPINRGIFNGYALEFHHSPAFLMSVALHSFTLIGGSPWKWKEVHHSIVADNSGKSPPVHIDFNQFKLHMHRPDPQRGESRLSFNANERNQHFNGPRSDMKKRENECVAIPGVWAYVFNFQYAPHVHTFCIARAHHARGPRILWLNFDAWPFGAKILWAQNHLSRLITCTKIVSTHRDRKVAAAFESYESIRLHSIARYCVSVAWPIIYSICFVRLVYVWVVCVCVCVLVSARVSVCCHSDKLFEYSIFVMHG